VEVKDEEEIMRIKIKNENICELITLNHISNSVNATLIF
jgi:hypothetical protein